MTIEGLQILVYLKILPLHCKYNPVDSFKDIYTKILISAEPKHEVNHEVQGASYVFSYHITIINSSDHPVQLLRRQWIITDGVFGEREIDGEGVIGQQPKLMPGEKFEYESWCPVSEEYGTMNGYYTFRELTNDTEFEVDIPTMVLLPQFALN